MFETSLARGFKLAAWVSPDRPVDPALLDLLDAGPRFWYSRVSLIHAIGIRLAAGRGTGYAARGTAALRDATLDPHPLVREAAEVTLRSVAASASAEVFSWLAETDMARDNTFLGDRAQRLLGDVSLLLNLVYCAEPWSDRLADFLATTDSIPECIRRPADRQRFMRGGCPGECAFGLCPYPGPSRRGRGRGELSGGFCRTQSDLALHLPRAPWQQKHSRREMADFWLWAEEHLANRDGWEINL
jgi:hypothetical protein